jgi:hypothetical protein
LIFDDIAQVVYAPVKAFKKIIENPKYLGALIILLLFIGVQIGYEYVQFSRTYTENTSPAVDQLPAFLNMSYWNSTSNLALDSNYADPFNYSIYVAALGTTPTDPNGYYSVFGNSSLEMNINGTGGMSAAALNVQAALLASSNNKVSSVDCSSPSGFQNLSMVIKQVQPTVAPQNATLTLYSFSDSNFYTYDLTSDLSNTSAIDLWNNITIPVGQNVQGWTSSGSPSWGNLTALQLTLNYPASSNVTIRIGALFFRGQYQTPIQYNNFGLLLQFLQEFSLQFILGWFLITGFIYLFFKGLKASVLWKPLFVAVGFAMFILVIRALINLVAAATLPPLYYPFDVSLGVRFDAYGAIFYPPEAVGTLSAQAQVIFNSINSATATFRFVTSAVFIVAYVWLGALGTIIVGTLKPEFTLIKRIVISAVSIGLSVLLLLFLVGIV